MTATSILLERSTLEADGGTLVGRDPRKISADEWVSVGIEKTPLLAVIRAKCLDCSSGMTSEVAKCVAASCALWPYRMNHNPFVTRALSDEQKAEAAERLAKARAKKFSETA